MRLSIHGSRTLSDERVRIIILETVAKHAPTAIVTHGEPEGVCELARKMARELALPLTLHFLNFKFLRGAFEHRSKAVLQDSDHALFIHDGKSKGTSNEIILARKRDMPLTIHVLPTTHFKASVGFPVDGPWDLEAEIETVNIPPLDLGDPKPSKARGEK